MPKFTVLALVVKDTAIIDAPTDEAAINMYETPDELEGVEDVLVWAIPYDEFEKMVSAGKEGEEPCITVLAAGKK